MTSHETDIARARNTDPVTSHEAAATVDVSRSQEITLLIARRYLGDYFTDQGLTEAYHLVRNTLEQAGEQIARVSDSRLRTARNELTEAGLVFPAGYTSPATGRRRRIWTLDPQLTEQDPIE